jgi:hypothetical protein
MDTLGEDLVLLSIRPEKGIVATAQRIDYGLMGSELVRLAASGRIDIQADRVIVRDQAPTGDAELDAALQSLVQSRRPPRPKAWVGRPRRGIRVAYLNRLAAAGVLRVEPGRIFGTRWYIADHARVASASARLDAIALSTGPVDTAASAYAGLAHAIGLDAILYPGFGNRAVRKRMQQLAKGQPAAAAVTGAVADEAARAATQAVTDAATMAATDAATHAAVHAATHAAVHGAVHAATQASVEAAHHAGGGAGAGGGHH